MRSTTTTPDLVIFSDLDGTLLDKASYGFGPARPAIERLRELGIPLVPVSSKTRAEIEAVRRRMGNEHPFISENGGAVFIPEGYFPFSFPFDRTAEGYSVVELGVPYTRIREVLEAVRRETGAALRGFGDLSESELADASGLDREAAALARKREYDEPFLVEGGEETVQRVKERILEKGMSYVWGGRFHHILGKNDKGKAVRILKDLYTRHRGSVRTAALGDSANDLPMLMEADCPFFLRDETEGGPLSQPGSFRYVRGTGPRAWNEAVMGLLNERPA